MDNDCILLSEEYKSTREPLEYIGKCGHKCIKTLKNIRLQNNFCCKKCSGINKQTMEILLKTFEILYQKILNYRWAHEPENYYKTSVCTICKRRKTLMLFALLKDKREKRCKLCKQNDSSPS